MRGLCIFQTTYWGVSGNLRESQWECVGQKFVDSLPVNKIQKKNDHEYHDRLHKYIFTIEQYGGTLCPEGRYGE
jgi:hypothetical protein